MRLFRHCLCVYCKLVQINLGAIYPKTKRINSFIFQNRHQQLAYFVHFYDLQTEKTQDLFSLLIIDFTRFQECVDSKSFREN